MTHFIVVAKPLYDDDCVAYVGPVADNIPAAVEGWYLQVCNAQGWAPSHPQPVCSEHEELINLVFQLRASEPFVKHIGDRLCEEVSIAETRLC